MADVGRLVQARESSGQPSGADNDQRVYPLCDSNPIQLAMRAIIGLLLLLLFSSSCSQRAIESIHFVSFSIIVWATVAAAMVASSWRQVGPGR